MKVNVNNFFTALKYTYLNLHVCELMALRCEYVHQTMSKHRP